jgi:type II secretory pathway component GspD/PulD (secretin)
VYAEEEEDAEESFQTEDAMVKSIALSDAPLSQVLYIIEELTGKAVLQDSKLGNVPINLQIRKEISKEEAIRAIESVLAINHIAIVELGDGLLKAVSMQSAPTQSPFFVDYSLLDVVPSEKICSKIFQLHYLSVDEFSKLITNLLNPEIASAIVFSDSNSMLITDSIANLQRVELILSRVDIPKHSVLDSKIFRIKHGDAKEVADLLNKVIKGQLNTRNKESGNTSNGPTEPLNPLENMSSFQFSKNLTIEHDARSNAVITCGTSKDIELVESIINQIDVLLDQVRIEVVIAKVTLTKAQASGLESLGINNIANGTIGNHYNPTISPKISKAGTMEQNPFSVDGTIKNFSLNTVFNKARSDSHVKILSAPTIVTTHNREALVRIVDSHPVIKSDISESTGAASTAIKSTIEYKDVGIELHVKPLIGINGVIQLEISQKIEDKKEDVEINHNKMPSMSKSEAVSFVSVYDGDTVILAGLQQKKNTKTGGKLWLLGDIPVIGNWLFSPKGVSEETTELIIFIKPTIISNPANEKAFAERMLDGSELQPEIEHYDRTGKFLPGMQFPKGTLGDPHIDYSQISSEDNNSKECKCGNKCKCKAENLEDPLVDYDQTPPEDNNSKECEAEKTDSKEAVDLTSEEETSSAKLFSADIYIVGQPENVKYSDDDDNFIKHIKKHRRRKIGRKAPPTKEKTTKTSNQKTDAIRKPGMPLINERQGSKKFRSRNS